MPPTRAKIVCTLGPASHDRVTLTRMIEAGMTVARLNFSHGTREDHAQMLRTVRQASADTGRVVGILLDLQGPKVRVGRFPQGQVLLESGQPFTITGRAIDGSAQAVSTTYELLAHDVRPGDRILLDDGLLSLRVREVEDLDVHCEVVVGGVLRNNKGINIPGAALSVATITEKDFQDADFGVEQGVDFIAMSFVRQAADILQMREYLQRKQAPQQIVSKIEKPQALDHIEDIIAVSDGIMVARGDLGVEMAPEEVPAIQKRLIALCNEAGKPVITATQMLESMVTNPRPTRAEASDVANAILDGSDAVMLSAESASGKHPVESVEVMQRIIRATESTRPPNFQHRRESPAPGTLAVHEGIALAACTLSEQVDAAAIASITLTGSMSKQIAKHRPAKRIFAISQFERVLRQLAFTWGVEGVHMGDLTSNIDDALSEVETHLRELGHVDTGERLVLTAGVPFTERQASNMVRVDVVK
ncbi:MAG TPA: pyruvate kinase [bacterium]|nr:pyruvate kinase [bacterium]